MERRRGIVLVPWLWFTNMAEKNVVYRVNWKSPSKENLDILPQKKKKKKKDFITRPIGIGKYRV